MSGSQSTTTENKTKDPWAPAQPVLQDVLTNARMYGNDPSMFTPTFSGDTRAGIADLAKLRPDAQNGLLPGLINQTQQGYGVGNNTLMTTASGGMLGGNPYLDAVLKTSTQRAADAVNAQMSGAGRYGSGAHTGVLADRLGAIETNARMQDYTTERGNQMNAAGILNNDATRAAGFAGQYDAATAQGVQNQIKAGAIQDQMSTAERTAPHYATQWMSGLAQPIAGLGGTQNGTTTTSTPANTGGMIAGAAMAGLGAATGNPMMMMNGVSTGLGAASGGSGGGGGGGGGGGSMFDGSGSGGGLFGRPSPVYSDPGTAVNGGWSTTATPAFNPWGGFFGGS